MGVAVFAAAVASLSAQSPPVNATRPAQEPPPPVALHARVVNQGGTIQANTVRNVGGVIELVASESVNLQAGSAISAQGVESGARGGEVRLKSDGAFTDTAGSSINVSGSSTGGDGGRVALSAPQMGEIASRIEARAAAGSRGGEQRHIEAGVIARLGDDEAYLPEVLILYYIYKGPAPGRCR